MAMEVLAAEFPDIFNQYIEIVPEVVTEEVEVLPVAPVAPSPVPVEEVRVVNVTSKTIQDIFLEHDYGQKAFVQEDANQNFSKTDFQNTVFSIEEKPTEMTIQTKENLHVAESPTPYSVESRSCAPYDELDQILEDLRQCEQAQDSNSNILFQLEQEKSSLGCNWTSEYSSCDHGPVCPFTSKVLDLSKFPESPAVSRNSVVVLRNTPAGYVQQHPVSLGLRSLNPQLGFTMAPARYMMPGTISSSSGSSSSSNKLNDITNQRLSSYRPPANTVLIKVPGPGLSLCPQCDSQFADNKSLVKHTRNQHQVYQCSKCGESTVGYYRMASHAKKNHSKEPSLFCPCGRTFSEKRGLAKHQNSCIQFKNS